MKGTEFLENAYLHMKELIWLVEENPVGVEMEWFGRCKEFVEDLKTWTPEIYIYLSGGNIQGVSANCRMHFNLWDDDNERAEESSESAYNYNEKHEAWNDMIEEGHEKGFLKSIY